jgi:AcrR family transcriptional regulator
MECDTTSTRERLITVAEELMAVQGADAVDLKEIQRAAGQRNRSAINYHFGDRDGLLDAIRDRHRGPINAERNRRLDELEATGSVTVQNLVDALIRPIARGLDNRSGRNYLIIVGVGAARLGARRLMAADLLHVDSMHRWNTMFAANLRGSRAHRHCRVGQVLLTSAVLLGDIARDVNDDAITERQGRAQIDDVAQYVIRAVTDS